MASAARCALALLLCLSWAQRAPADTAVIALHHADASQVAAALAGTLPDGAAIRVYRQQLVLSGSPADIAGMKELIALLDAPSRQLLISLRSAQTTARQRDQVSISGGGQAPHSQRWPGATSTSTLTVVRQSRGGTLAADGTQSIRAAEGQDALLLLSAPVALPVGQGRSVVYDAGTGFWVNARISGGRAVVALRSRERQAGTSGNVIHIDTQLSGPIGQWLPVGDLSGGSARSERSLTSAERSGQSSASTMMLKVELLDGLD